jgi:hypothetical protein
MPDRKKNKCVEVCKQTLLNEIVNVCGGGKDDANA